MRFSYFDTVNQTTPDRAVTLAEVHSKITGSTLKDDIDRLRNCPYKSDGQKKQKVKLPAVTFTGEFTERNSRGLSKRSGFVGLDFDDLDHAADFRNKLKEDPYCHLAYVTPSGRGVKAVYRTDPALPYSECWKALAAYCKRLYGVDADPATKDVSRLAFLTWDPDAHLNEKCPPLPVDAQQGEVELINRELDEYLLPVGDLTREEVDHALSFIPPRPPYDEWIKVIAAVAAHLGTGQEAIDALCKWSPEEKKGEYAVKLNSGLNRVGSGSLIYLARLHGWEPLKRWESLALRWKRIDDSERAEEVGRFLSQGDAGRGELLAVMLSDHWRWNFPNKVWMHYKPSSGCWEADPAGGILPFGRNALKLQALNALERLEELESLSLLDGIEGAAKAKDLETRQKSLRQAVKQLNSRKGMQDALAFTAPLLAVDEGAFDSDPDSICLSNGVLDLPKGELRQHSPSSMNRFKANAAWDPNAKCPAWERFIELICCRDEALAHYLQKLLGYCLSGRVDADILPLVIGNGSNGKSTLFKVLEELLGTYAGKISVEALLQQGKTRDNVALYEIAQMAGKRLLLASEIPPNRSLNENLAKDLTGGDTVEARRPYGLPFSVAPSAKIFLFGNTVPKVKGSDDGIWRRIKIIPMRHRFPAAGEKGSRDRSVVLNELLKERDGILQWLFKGFKASLAEGFEPPIVVKRETRQLREDSDLLTQWFEQKAKRSSGKTEGRKLLDSITAHYLGANQRPPQAQDVWRFLEAKGIERKKIKGYSWAKGIALQELGTPEGAEVDLDELL